MKTIPILLALLGSLFCQAQYSSVDNFPKAVLKQKEFDFQKNKAVGDTLYYQDFAGGVPVGWSVVDNSGSNYDWVWSVTPPGGQYSNTIAALNSTSALNGFMSLPSDFYNTPFPVSGPQGMDAYFVSGPIVISPKSSIDIYWQQSSRYCCSGADELVFEVSTDSLNWTTYDAINGRGANTAVPSPTSAPAEIIRLNVSTVLANEDTAYVRFRMTGATHYYWMIDDFVITEGFGDVMELEDFEISFFNDFSINPLFYMIPRHMMDSVNFRFYTKNEGSNTQTGVRGHVTVTHDSLPNGQTGVGVVGSVINYLGIPVPYLQRDTFNVGPYVYQNTPIGFYSANLNIVTNTASQLPSYGQGSYQFEITDSVMSRVAHDSTFIGDVGPLVLWSGIPDGSRLVSLFSTGRSPSTLNSISLYVANVTTNIGSVIRAQVWNWNDTASNLNWAIDSLLAVSDSIYIDSTLLGTWITLPLQNQLTLKPNVQLLAGWEQVAGNLIGAEFSVGRDRYQEQFQPPVSNFVYINDATPSWGWITSLGAIRLNFALAVGVQENEEDKLSFSMFPNPSNGQFKIHFKSISFHQYTLKIRNTLGQILLEEQVLVNGDFSKNIDLSDQRAGIYFVSLENETERIVEKLIVQ